MAINRSSAAKWYLVLIYLNFSFDFIRGIVLVPLYLSHIDPRLYGAWLACGDIMIAMAFLDLGIGRVLAQKVAETYGMGDTSALAKICSAGLWICIAISLFPLLLGLLGYPHIGSVVRIEGEAARELGQAFLIASVAASFMLLFNGFSAVMIGLQKQILITSVGLAGLLTGIVTTVVLLFNGAGLIAIPLGSLAGAVQSAIAAAICVAVTVGIKTVFSRSTLRIHVIRGILRDSLTLFLGSVAFVIVARIPNTFIAYFFDPFLCTIYTFSVVIQTMLTGLVVALSQAISPGLAHFAGEFGRLAARKIVIKVLKISLMGSALVMAGMLVLSDEFIRMWVGGQYYGGLPLTLILCANGMVSGTFLVFQNCLVALGGFGTATKSNTVKSVVHACLLVGLGFAWQLNGLAMAMVISFASAISLIQAPFFLTQYNIDLKQYTDKIVKFAAYLAIPFCVAFAMKASLNPTGIKAFVVFGSLYVVIAGGLYYLIDPDVRELAIRFVPKSSAAYFRR